MSASSSSSSSPAHSEADEEEFLQPDPDFPTPMEKDAELQAAELTFRSLLGGNKISVDHRSDDDWNLQYLGRPWVEQNRRQRKVLNARAKAEGVNTPMWIEAAANIGDLAEEVFAPASPPGAKTFVAEFERFRSLHEIDRAELMQIFQELAPKLKISYYARCGFSHNLIGLRACVTVLHLFREDAEVVELCARCLRYSVVGHSFNRDALAELSADVGDVDVAHGNGETMGEAFRDRGWTFLRCALDAFLAQGSSSPTSREAALRVASAFAAVASARAAQVQLMLLCEELPEDPCQDWRVLHDDLVPRAWKQVRDMLAKESNPTLQSFHAALALAVADSDKEAAPLPSTNGVASPSESSDMEQVNSSSLFSGLAAGVRGLLGR